MEKRNNDRFVAFVNFTENPRYAHYKYGIEQKEGSVCIVEQHACKHMFRA